MNRFSNDKFELSIYNNVINTVFPSLVKSEKTLLTKYLIRIIDVLYLVTNCDKSEFEHQMMQNNYQDPKWLLFHLLPHIDDHPDARSKLSQITTLQEIYMTKIKDVDVNKIAPQYRFSNIQYGRCKRGDTGAIEINFDKLHLEQNYLLLLSAIRKSSNKQYVNWIDIRPISINNYFSIPVYRETRRALMAPMTDFDPILVGDIKQTENLFFDKIASELRGLSMEDIYNTISNYFFYDIVDIKWLLYDIFMNNSGGNNVTTPFILFFGDLCRNMKFDDKNFLSNTLWRNLSDDNRLAFINLWKMFYKNSVEHKNIQLNHNIYRPQGLSRFIRSFIVIFQKRYVERRNIPNYIPINLDKDQDDEEDDPNTAILSDELVNKTIQSIDPQYIYDFLRDSLNKFKYTWYGYRFLDIQKMNILHHDNFSKFHPDSNLLTDKVFYNFCKSLLMKPNNHKLVMFPKHWSSLTKAEKDIIFQRWNRTIDPIEWFNIKRYWKYVAAGVGTKPDSKEELDITHRFIYDVVKQVIIGRIFECLAVKGVLSYFTPCPAITDKSRYDRKNAYKSNIMKNIFQLDRSPFDWNQTYYYLTELPYSLLDDFEQDFINYNAGKTATAPSWYTMIALDWISQIGFVHHFVNNRVSYITGGTGVGKSTQVPKLFMYYLKAVDYNSFGSVACSQPRQNATADNAIRVSTELSVPIERALNNTDNDNAMNSHNDDEEDEENGQKTEETNLYYIQMQHQKKKHIKTVNHLTLKYITDGTLINQLLNPLGKRTRVTDKNITYLTSNIYDVVIIDEAHEHNKNMDLLLTRMKTSTYHNNAIRLVILSATMSDDEPTYRRYYRDINDNKKFPLNMWIKENKIDRINVDRRYHISAPGEGNRFIVPEHYVPEDNYVDVITKITKHGFDGDVLIFQPGTEQIKECIRHLNLILPPNVIAVPYYRDLTDKQKNIVRNLGDNIKKFKISKDVQFEDVQNYFEGTGRYDRFVIVATNIAEASITIGSLKYVIDTGTQKNNVYDYKRKVAAIETGNISETSRIQRKGRVGRNAPGVAYFLYEKGQMEVNKSAYKISQENIIDDVFQLLRDNPSEEVIFPIDFDCNDKNVTMNTKKLEQLGAINKNIARIIENQYFTTDEYYDYYGDDRFYDYDKFKRPEIYYQTGYDENTVIDDIGSFYIVHPDEPRLIRDIQGRIVDVNDPDIFVKNYKLISDKMISFIMEHQENLTLIKTDTGIVKSEFGKYINQIINEIQLETSYKRLLAYSKFFNCIDDALRLACILDITGNDIRKILYEDPDVEDKSLIRTKSTKTVQTLYRNQSNDSDIKILINIAKDIEQYLQQKKVLVEYKTYVENTMAGVSENTLNLISMKRIDITDQQMKDDYDFFIALIDKEIRNKARNFAENIDQTDQRDMFIKKGLNPETIYQFIKKYPSYYYAKREFEISRFINYIAPLSRKLLSRMDSRDDKLLTCIIISFPYNLCQHIRSTRKYISMYTPGLMNIYGTSKTLIDEMYKYGTVIHLTTNIEAETIGIIAFVPETQFKYIGHIILPEKKAMIRRSKIYDKIESYMKKHPKIDVIEGKKKVETGTHNILASVQHTLNEIIRIYDTKLDTIYADCMLGRN